MKYRKLVSAVLSIIMVFSLYSFAYAEGWNDFTDISGHWAEATMKRGFEDGLISGMDASSIAPDSPITAAQMITVLCRVLGASEKADITSLGISSDVWYADAAGKALYLGLISAETGYLDAPMTRQDALAMMAKAFCLVPAEPDLSVLDSFSDASAIRSENLGAMAALVAGGYIQGFDGALNAEGSITRAEFLTVLYRVAENYIRPYALSSGTDGGSVLKGGGSLNYISAGNIWFDCSAQRVSLSGVKADSVTLRSHNLTGLYIGGGTELSRFVVAVGSGNVSLDGSGWKVGRLRLESCTGASVGSCADNIDITGSGMAVSVSGAHDGLVITGNGNTVTLLSGVSLSGLRISGDDNLVKSEEDVQSPPSFTEADISGAGNIVSLGGVMDASGTIAVGGTLNDVTIESAGDIGSAELSGDSNILGMSCSGLSSVSISGNSNTFTKLGEGTVSAADIPGSENTFILSEGSEMTSAEISGTNNIITINGTSGSITLSGRDNTLDGSGSAGSLSISAPGCSVSLAADNVDDVSAELEKQRVLELVSLGYTGDYTLKWAQNHDYEDSDKELWVNVKGYSSSTGYLIWVNLSMQRVNIFKGSEGSWELVRSSIVGTGAPGHGTPVGVWRTTYKSWDGWTTSTYTVKPVVGFKSNTGYAFHSRLYYPGTTTISTPSIGYPVSHGCVRMYDEDVMYIYNNIPLGTTVVVY